MFLPITVVVLLSVLSVCGVLAIGLTVRVVMLLIAKSGAAGPDSDELLLEDVKKRP